MRRRNFVLFLILEILSSLIAVVLFKNLEDPRWAGVFAGIGFFTTGIVIVLMSWRWPEKWTLPTFWLAHVHVWVITLPMFLMRLAYWETPFTELRIMGMEGTLFHRVSEIIFTLLILATITDWLRCVLRKKTGRPAPGVSGS
ncbi:MAG: hypothetical protein H6624_16730 [Bdellovibrionaceae bacterium]|nr:hypothetical protein [Bdellovibrionales bacterium]MCB9085992.1 hypothetical protein [Pseudobdellovibrionaceae bacterium]